MTVTVVGLGLIGGSVARDLHRSGFAHSIVGVDSNRENCATALEMGLVGSVASLEEAVKAAEVVILAVPVNVIVKILPKVLDLTTPGQTVIDMGSTKQAITEVVKQHPNRYRFVAAHPMAGTERSGPTAAVERLFEGRIAILCDIADSAPDAVAEAKRLFSTGLRMNIVTMGAAAHDIHAAYISHLSHVISYALALTTLDKERDVNTLFSMAGGGFSSTARLAKSDATMWTPIFLQNRDHLLEAIAAYRQHLDNLAHAIEQGDEIKVNELIGQANRIRDLLP